MGLARENFFLKEKDNVLQKNHFEQKKRSSARAFSCGQSDFSENNPRDLSCRENLARENAFSSEPREIFFLKEKDNILQTTLFGQKKRSAARTFSRGKSVFFENNPRDLSYRENLARENAFLNDPREVSLLKEKDNVLRKNLFGHKKRSAAREFSRGQSKVFLFPLLSGVK